MPSKEVGALSQSLSLGRTGASVAQPGRCLHTGEHPPRKRKGVSLSPRRVAGSNPARGSTTEPPTLLIEFAFHLKKEGYAEQSIHRAVKVLRRLSKFSDLDNPDSVKTTRLRLDKWTTASKGDC